MQKSSVAPTVSKERSTEYDSLDLLVENQAFLARALQHALNLRVAPTVSETRRTCSAHLVTCLLCSCVKPTGANVLLCCRNKKARLPPKHVSMSTHHEDTPTSPHLCSKAALAGNLFGYMLRREPSKTKLWWTLAIGDTKTPSPLYVML